MTRTLGRLGTGLVSACGQISSLQQTRNAAECDRAALPGPAGDLRLASQKITGPGKRTSLARPAICHSKRGRPADRAAVQRPSRSRRPGPRHVQLRCTHKVPEPPTGRRRLQPPAGSLPLRLLGKSARDGESQVESAADGRGRQAR